MAWGDVLLLLILAPFVTAEHFLAILLFLAVLCIFRICDAPKRAGEKHGGSYASNRQSPQTWHPRHGEWRYRYHITITEVLIISCRKKLWWYEISYSCFFRFGKRREEETWGKTENGSEKSHQIHRGMENKVCHWDEVYVLAPLLTSFANFIHVVFYYFLHPLLNLKRNSALGPRFGSKLCLLFVFFGVKCCTKLHCLPQEKVHYCNFSMSLNSYHIGTLKDPEELN